MTRFCPACGEPLAEPPPTTCAACGVAHWANAKPCAAALVVDMQGRVLLTRRAHAPWLGLWCAPSGFCDGPEHPITAAEREVREEAGVHARVTGYLGTWISPYADDAANATEHVSVQYYAAELVGNPEPVVDPAEVSEARWFAPHELPAGLAPETTLRAALAALAVGPRVTPLPDRQ
ncbi:MAG: NUDIX hydrolase [Gaiellales bacterium]